MAVREEFDAWFRETIRFYRELEFFRHNEYAGLNDEDIPAHLDSQVYGWLFDRYREAVEERLASLLHLEQRLLIEDKDRVWWEDAEQVSLTGEFYAETLAALARISRNTFHPEHISVEACRRQHVYEFSPVFHVRYTLDNEENHIWVQRDGDYANRGFPHAINGAILGTGYCFAQCGDEQTWYVFSVHESEIAALEARGWEYLSIRRWCHCPGVLLWPVIADPEEPLPWEGQLFFERGCTRFTFGDEEGAWSDWHTAARLGMRDAYSVIADFCARQNRM